MSTIQDVRLYERMHYFLPVMGDGFVCMNGNFRLGPRGDDGIFFEPIEEMYDS